jgi:crotonobetainyl-CoA:carnitine CoA-transferase CaiB-like acyl-CoA transferase
MGQQVDISIMEVVNNLMTFPATTLSYLGRVDPGFFTRVGKPPGQGITPCKDGHVVVNVYWPREWEGFLAMVGAPELMEEFLKDAVFMPIAHTELIRQHVLPWFMEHTAEEIFHLGQELHCAIAPVPTIDKVVNSPQYQAREFFLEVEHPQTGKVVYPGAPFKMALTPWQIKRHAPLLGEHNKEVYSSLGYSSEDLAKLRERGII